ncbi:MAG: NADPH-dependent FMN reductase [Thermomicrobiales bacterium]
MSLLADHDSLDGAPVRVLGIGGSMRAGSRSLSLLRHALRVAETAGAGVALGDVRQMALPMYDDDLPLEDYPTSLRSLLDSAREADAFVFCSPTYHGTLSGAVKNAFDCLNFLVNDTPRYLQGKPIALMALGGSSAGNVITALDHSARGLNGLVLPTSVIASGSAVQDGEVADPRVQQRVQAMVAELLDVTSRLRAHTPVLSLRQ